MSDVTERLTKGEENDYHPVNQYIDEQSKLRRARSFLDKSKILGINFNCNRDFSFIISLGLFFIR